ncbi:acetyl-CoA synthetase-like protein [Tuber magnatum]|uniref:Acetyl-CoA synthetase-like protein n=1 Tax=Tuber magnatum TaxID=42249 RepID=A0A317SHN0_9PEZI|nr:acetyl-CoA synthetase-like protein [Tuber magnatum]
MTPQVKQVVWPCMSKRPPFNLQVPGVEKKDGEGVPRRHPGSMNGLRSRLEPDIATTYDIVKRGAAKFGDAQCLGSRTLIKQHEEIKMLKKVVDGVEREVPKTWIYYEMSGYKFLSFKEYLERVNMIGAGLKALGLEKGEKVQIFSATRQLRDSGCASQSLPIVTAYDTLGQSGLTHSLVQTEARAIFLDSQLLPQLVGPLKEATGVRYVIYNTDQQVKQEHIDKLKGAHERLRIVSVDELVKLGQENPIEPDPSGPEDLCGIMYTSGSTGTPKGVPLLQKNVIAAVTGVTVITQPYIGPGDCLLTFLPLAHILELVFENACIFWGGTMGYGSSKTISDRSMKNCRGDIQEFRPTVLVGVPAVWETVKKGIMDQVSKQSALTQKLFWGALALKSFLLQTGIPGTAVLDAVVFKKIKAATGGRLKICMNGGGPIAGETQHFVSMTLCPMIIGYGLTETSAMGALMDPAEWNVNSLGTIPASVEIKLIDFPDAGYFTANEPEQGEIWIRGESVATSYFKNEEESKEAFEDGWFKTGDIGEWDKNGHLKIIDRKKNLVKTSNGEYIALEKLESVYRACPLVANICVYADKNKTKPVALIVPVEGALKKLAAEAGVEGELEELVHDDRVRVAVLRELIAAGRKGGLAGIELVEGVVLTEEEWTPQNNLVTSAQKLNRRGILEKYKKEVDRAYGAT